MFRCLGLLRSRWSSCWRVYSLPFCERVQHDHSCCSVPKAALSLSLGRQKETTLWFGKGHEGESVLRPDLLSNEHASFHGFAAYPPPSAVYKIQLSWHIIDVLRTPTGIFFRVIIAGWHQGSRPASNVLILNFIQSSPPLSTHAPSLCLQSLHTESPPEISNLSNITSQLSAEPQRRAVLAVSTSCVCLRVCLRTTPAASQQSCLFDTLSHSLLFPYLSYLSLKFPYSNALMDRGRNRVL